MAKKRKRNRRKSNTPRVGMSDREVIRDGLKFRKWLKSQNLPMDGRPAAMQTAA